MQRSSAQSIVSYKYHTFRPTIYIYTFFPFFFSCLLVDILLLSLPKLSPRLYLPLGWPRKHLFVTLRRGQPISSFFIHSSCRRDLPSRVSSAGQVRTNGTPFTPLPISRETHPHRKVFTQKWRKVAEKKRSRLSWRSTTLVVVIISPKLLSIFSTTDFYMETVRVFFFCCGIVYTTAMWVRGFSGTSF